MFLVLRKAFESFDSNKSGSISTETVAEILRLMGQPFNKQILEEMIEEVDEDKSGRLEFEEFIILAAKFIVEEDEEARKSSSLHVNQFPKCSLTCDFYLFFENFQSRKN